MPVKIPTDAELDARLVDAGLLKEHGEEILGVAAGFPLMGVGLTQVFRAIDGTALTSSQKMWAKVASTAALGFGGGLGIIALGKAVREKTISEITTFAGVGAAAVGIGSIALQTFQAARGAGILPRKGQAEGQLLPVPEEMVPLPGFQFR